MNFDIEKENLKEQDQQVDSLIQVNQTKAEIQNNLIQKKPVKFKIGYLEIGFIFPLGITAQMLYLLYIGYKSYQIQEQKPMVGVVKSWFGLYRDDSDGQWREFRENIFIFIGAIISFNLITQLIKNTFINNQAMRFNLLITFYIISGIGYLLFLFNFGGFFLWFLLTFFNYFLEKLLGKYRLFPIIMWSLQLWCIYYNYFYKNEPYLFIKSINPKLGDYLYHSYRTAIVPWGMVYNMTILRIIAYSLDKHWEYQGIYKFDTNKHISKCDLCKYGKICYKMRSEQYLKRKDYNNIFHYYAYLTYVPIFITGPQITYNAFISQVYNNQKQYSNKEVMFYAMRAINNILVLEIYTHSNFASALSKINANRKFWINFSGSECLFMGFLNLIFIWLKFLTIWRLARAASLIDGIDSPENMNRCIFNNYCFEGFWRSWHRGFNQWLIRYIFIPLGGSKTKLWNIWIVFTFVAIWHDLELNLVLWAWFICAALIPEMIVKTYASKQQKLWEQKWFTYFCSLCATIYIWLMILANLIGFGSGYDNIKIIVDKFFEPNGFTQLLIVIALMYPLTFFQFWIRNKEADNNLNQGF